MKKIHKLLCFILLISLLSAISPFVYLQNAQAVTSPTQDEQKAKKRREVRIFLASTIDFNRFKESFHDYIRGYCQRTEAIRLRKELKELRRDIIDSILEELNFNVDEMINEYYKTDIQLYFVRNFTVSSYDFNPLDKNEFGKKMKRKELESNMQKYFVTKKSYVDTDTLTKYIDEFYKRYDQDSFINCMDPSIKGISLKIDSIKDKITNLNMDNLWEDLELDEPIIYQAETVKDSPGQVGKTFLKGHLGLRLANLESKKAANDIYEEIINTFKSDLEDTDQGSDREKALLDKYYALKKKYSGKKTDTEIAKEVFADEISVQSLSEAEAKEEKAYQLRLAYATRLARYEVQFGETEDTITTSFVTLIQTLNTTIKNTIPILADISKCLDTAFKKQCSE